MQKQKNVIIGIYKITSPSGKVYIGQSINIEDRKIRYRTLNCKGQTKLYNSLKKYGFEQHIFEIIELCSEDKLLERETHWKVFYKVLEVPSLCCRIDGRGGRDSEETKLNKLKRSNSFKDEILELYKNKSILEISEVLNLDYGTIKSLLLREDKYIKGKNYKKHPESRKEKMKIIMINKLGIPVLQKDKNNQIINEYLSQAEASRQTGIRQGDISTCCRGRQKTAGGFKWEYKNNI